MKAHIKEKILAKEQENKDREEEQRLREYGLQIGICPECGENINYKFARAWDWGSDEYEWDCPSCKAKGILFK